MKLLTTDDEKIFLILSNKNIASSVKLEEFCKYIRLFITNNECDQLKFRLSKSYFIVYTCSKFIRKSSIYCRNIYDGEMLNRFIYRIHHKFLPMYKMSYDDMMIKNEMKKILDEKLTYYFVKDEYDEFCEFDDLLKIMNKLMIRIKTERDKRIDKIAETMAKYLNVNKSIVSKFNSDVLQGCHLIFKENAGN